MVVKLNKFEVEYEFKDASVFVNRSQIIKSLSAKLWFVSYV